MFIEKERLITLRIEFYGHSGQLIKTQVNGRPEQVSETAWRMGTTFVENHEESHQTRVEVTHRSVDDKIDEDTFTERHIRTGRYLE